MKEKLRKVIGLLLSMSIILGVMPSMAMAAESDGYYIKLEESDVKNSIGFTQNKTYDFYSGGKALVLGEQSAPSEDGYFMAFEVDIAKAGNYTIWTYGGQSGSEYVSPVSIVIDDTTTLTPGSTTGSTWANSYGFNSQVAYQNVKANLTVGTHTIKYLITTTAPDNPSWYLGAFDFMMIVPEGYTWTPSKTELPAPPEYKDFNEEGYAWLQETDKSNSVGFTETRNKSTYSDGSAIGLNTTTAPGTSGYYVDYYLNVPKAGSYDIWVHGTVPNDWASPVKVQLNGESITMKKIGDDEWDSPYVSGWNKATVELDSGRLDLRYLVNEVRPEGGTYIAILDMICIVPTEYGWTQSISNKPVKPAPVVPDVETDGYYIKLEETNAKESIGFTEEQAYEFYSGGQALILGTQSAPSEDGYYMEFEVDIAKAGNYTIWTYGGQSGSDYASPVSIVIDDTTTLTPGSTTGSTWANSYGFNSQVAYQNVKANLTVGTHTIKYLITTTAPDNTSWYLGAFDFMMIVPEGYTWTPSKTELPAPPEYKDFNEEGYAWLQETDKADSVGFTETRKKSTYSDGSAIGLNTTTAPGASGYYVDYYLNVPKAGSYDIWVHGAVPNDWASPVKVQLNGESITMKKIGDDEWDSPYVSGWNKATVELEAGELDLRYLVNEVRPEGGTYIAILDMICIVPTEYGWTQSITTKPVAPEYKDFHADGYAWLEAEDYSNKHQGWDKTLSDGGTTDAVSGSGLGISTSTAPGADGYYIDFNINVEEAGNYDIWVYGGRIGYEWVSAGKIKIDGTDPAQQLAHYSRDDWGKISGSAINLGWSKATANLSAGKQVLRYYIDETIAGNNTTYQGALDLICVVPSSYGWVPAGTGKVTAKPVAPEYKDFNEEGYVWLEETDKAKSIGFTDTRKNSMYSDGSASTMSTEAAPGASGYYIDYYLNVPKAGSYDIWVHGSVPNDWASPVKVQLNGEAITMKKIGDDAWDESYVSGWTKATVELEEGELDLRYLVNEVRPEGKVYIAVFDMICIVPTEYGWTQSITNKPVKPGPVEFTLDGEMTVGDTTVNATVYFGEEATDKEVLVIPTLFGSDGLVKCANVIKKSFTQKDNYLDINMVLDESVAEGDIFTVFIWDSINLGPKSPKLTLGNKL